MGVTIHVNGTKNSLAHKGCNGITKCTLPDVCKTPSPGGPVPVPYPVIVSMSNSLKKGTKTVKVDSKKMAAVKGSQYSRCNGDEPGTAGGVKSSTNMKEATWLLYSFDVKLDGKNACRLSDKMMMNHGNTACLGGTVQVPVPQGDCSNENVVCCVIERCDEESYDISYIPTDAENRVACAVLGTAKHKCVENSLKKDKKQRFDCEQSFNMRGKPPSVIKHTKGRWKGKAAVTPNAAYNILKKAQGYVGRGQIRRPDVKTPGYPCQIYDAKFPCPDSVRSDKQRVGRMDSDLSRNGEDMMKTKRGKKQKRAYKKIAGPKKKGGQFKPLSPSDCKKKKSCEACS